MYYKKSEFSSRPRTKSTYFDFNTFKTIQTSQEFHLHSIKTIRSHFEVVQEQDSNFDKFRQFFRNKSRVCKNIKSSCFNFKPVTVKMNSVGLQKASSEHLCENSSNSVVQSRSGFNLMPRYKEQNSNFDKFQQDF